MKWRLIIPVAIFCALFLFTSADAQNELLPIVQVRDGQISIGEYSHQAHGYCQPPEVVLSVTEISPDGFNLIIVTRPRVVTEAIEAYGPFGGAELPQNLWLCDLHLGMLKLLAGQPEGASFAESDAPDNTVTRSNPQFSPEGTAIAWLETRPDDEQPFLMIYDLVTENLHEHPTTLPQPCCVPHSWPMLWHETGIWLYGTLVETTFEDRRAVLLRLSETGDELEIIDIESVPLGMFIASEGDDGGEDRFVMYGGGVPLSFRLFDPVSGEIFGITPGTQGYLELYNPLDPNRVSLVAVPTSDGISWLVRDSWQIQVDGIGEPIIYQTPGLAHAQRFAPGTDGYLMVWQERVVFWKDGAYILNPGLSQERADSHVALFWGPRAWRLWRPREPLVLTATPPDAVTCDGFMPSRLKGLDYGFVLTRDPNNLRAEPALSGQLIGQLPAGAEFFIWQGPVCADGYAWWHVEYDGLIGWTAEGQAREYWLAPAY